MTDQPDPRPDVTEPIAASPVPPAPPAAVGEPKPSRWARLRPRSRLSQVATAVVAAAAAVFVAGAIFATGFALGSGGGEHHRHGGGGGQHSWQADHHDQGWNGQGHRDHRGQGGEHS